MSHHFNDDLSLEPRPMWNMSQDNQALRLEEAGLSRKQIANVMKMTPSAIAGRLWRLKNGAASVPVMEEKIVELPKAVLLPIAIEKTNPNIKSFHPKTVSNDHVPQQKPTIESLFLPLSELPEDACRFPVGGATCCEKEHLFCGEEAYTSPGKKYHSPYCRKHYDMAYYRRY